MNRNNSTSLIRNRKILLVRNKKSRFKEIFNTDTSEIKKIRIITYKFTYITKMFRNYDKLLRINIFKKSKLVRCYLG